MKISLVTNNMGISDKLRFRHHILSLMLGLPVVLVCLFCVKMEHTDIFWRQVLFAAHDLV